MSLEAGEFIPEGLGRSHGTSRQTAFDRWFRYPAGFSSDAVETLFAKLALQPGQAVVDPFAGCGVTGTAARSRHLGYLGIEAHPEIAELGRLKLLDPPQSPYHLLSILERVLARASQRPTPPIAQEADLVQRCFNEATLIELIKIREALAEGAAGPWYLWIKWALLGTLRDVARVKVGWPYQRPSADRKAPFTQVGARLRQRSKWMVEDLVLARSGVIACKDKTSSIPSEKPYVARSVVTGDAQDVSSWSSLNDPADGCVSSPPYLNNFDYADATRLETYFWGTVRSWSELCSEIRKDMLIATTQQTSVALADQALEQLARSPDILRRVERLIGDLSEQRHARPRGKEYDRVLPVYAAGMAEVLRRLAEHLAPGAPCLWLVGDSAPYGVYIDTPDLLGQIAENCGFDRIDDITLRKRGLRWTGTSHRHQQALTERLLWLRRSA